MLEETQNSNTFPRLRRDAGNELEGGIWLVVEFFFVSEIIDNVQVDHSLPFVIAFLLDLPLLV